MKKCILGLFALFLSVFQVSAGIDSNRFAPGVLDAFLKGVSQTALVTSYKNQFQADLSSFLGVPEKYKKLFIESQDVINKNGIKLPVVGFKDIKHGDFAFASCENTAALTTSQFMAINLNLLNKNEAEGVIEPYGFLKHISLHESVHAKYNDSLLRTFLKVNSISKIALMLLLVVCVLILLIFIVLKKCFKSKLVLSFLILLNVFTTLFGNKILLETDKKVFDWFGKFIEQRADLVALEHLQCHECAKEAYYGYYFGTEEAEKKSGYLSAMRFKEFARKYKDENKLCDLHKNINERVTYKLNKGNGCFKDCKVLSINQVNYL